MSLPRSEYINDSMYDMEAAGFYSAALRFCSSELIHCYKIVSDNEEFHVDNISKIDVVNLVEQNLEDIVWLSSLLLESSDLLDVGNKGNEIFKFLNSRYHFTVSQQAQLNSLLQNWYAITEESPVDKLDLNVIKNAKTLLSELQRKINEMPLNF